MGPTDRLTDLKLKGHLLGTLGPVIAVAALTARESHERDYLVAEVLTCHRSATVDCAEVPTGPTAVEELNKEAVEDLHCVLRLETVVNQYRMDGSALYDGCRVKRACAIDFKKTSLWGGKNCRH